MSLVLIMMMVDVKISTTMISFIAMKRMETVENFIPMSIAASAMRKLIVVA